MTNSLFRKIIEIKALCLSTSINCNYLYYINRVFYHLKSINNTDVENPFLIVVQVRHAVNNWERGFVLQAFQATISLLPRGFLCSLGNQRKEGNAYSKEPVSAVLACNPHAFVLCIA